MGTTKMGFEGKIFQGAKGSTAATEIENSQDISYNLETEDGETTVRGTGSAPPIETSRVVKRIVSIEWTMLNKTTDTSLTALLTAAFAGTPVAIRTKAHSTGTGFDGDCYLKVRHGKPLGGAQTYEFTAKPTDDEGRAVFLNV